MGANPELPVIQGLRKEREQPKYFDFIVSVSRKEFKCHKVILAATSEFFRGVFDSDMKETLEGSITLEGISSDVFGDILRWMYHGDSILTEDNMFDVFLAANQLQIETLLLETRHFLTSKLSVYNCARAYSVSQIRSWKELQDASWKILLENFDTVGITELDALSLDEMKRLVADNNLVTRSEDCVVHKLLKWVHRDQLRFSSESGDPNYEDRVKHLAELMRSCRYLLVSPNFLWNTLEKDPNVQSNPECCALIKETLCYQTLPETHQHGRPPGACHRLPSPLRDVLLSVTQDELLVAEVTEGRIKRWVEPDLKCPQGVSAAVFYKGSTYFEVVEERMTLLCVYDADIHETKCCYSTETQIHSKTVAMHPVGDALIAVRTNDNERYFVESLKLPCTVTSRWNFLGHLRGRGMKVACVSNVGSLLVVLWESCDKEEGSLCVESYDVGKQFTHVTPFRLTSTKSAVTFKKDCDVYVLQSDGVLWKLSYLDSAPYLTMTQVKRLWLNQHQLTAAVLVADQLHIERIEPKPYTDIQWCEPRGVDGVFDQIEVLDVNDKIICCIHSVVNCKALGTAP